MFITDGLDINDNGHLTIGGLDTVSLAKQYGTPLYVMNEEEIRRACRRYVASVNQYYHGNGLVLYAGKAFLCKEMCRIIADEGMGLDVVSGGELYTALQVDFPQEKIVFHGNNKTVEELLMAVQYNVGYVVVDNLYELELLNSIAASSGKRMNIMLRVKPGIDAHTHDFVRTGQIDSKFGLALETGEALEAVEAAASMKNVKVKALHCHIGSQIFDIAPFEHAAEVMIGFMKEIRERLGVTIEGLNLGGGFGIKYVDRDDPAHYDDYMKRISVAVKAACEAGCLDLPQIFIEPGRSIAGAAGTTLYTVGGIKQIPGVRKYVSVDGGMTDNPRYALYGSEYSAVIANRAGEPKDDLVTVAGKCCESGDLIGENLLLQKQEIGDILAVLSTGAYNFSMASNYNRIQRPAVVMVRDGKSRLAVKRQTFEDLVVNDI